MPYVTQELFRSVLQNKVLNAFCQTVDLCSFKVLLMVYIRLALTLKYIVYLKKGKDAQVRRKGDQEREHLNIINDTKACSKMIQMILYSLFPPIL